MTTPPELERRRVYKRGTGMTMWTAQSIAEHVGAECRGDGSKPIMGIASLSHASCDDLSFLANEKYANQLAQTKASAVICHPSMADKVPGTALVHPSPYLAYAKASHLFAPVLNQRGVIAPTAVIHETAHLALGVSVGPGAVIEQGVSIGANTVIGPNVVIGANTTIGADCRLHAGVVIYHGITIGQRVELHSGVVVGADGFGFAPSSSGWVKIEQLGGVVIGDDVNVGAGTTIDRGALDDTVIEAGVILDNQIQVAHNVFIGAGTAIAGCTGIAGSAKIGRRCLIGGQCGIAGHIEICDNVQITTNTLVTKSITQSGSYSGATAMTTTKEWRKNATRGRQLYEWTARIQTLEKALAELSTKLS